MTTGSTRRITTRCGCKSGCADRFSPPHAHARTDREHHAERLGSVHPGPLLAIYAGPINLNARFEDTVTRPDRVLHLVTQQCPFPVRPVAPLMFLEPVLGGVFRRHNRLRIRTHRQTPRRSATLESILGIQNAIRRFHTLTDLSPRIRLVVEPPRNQCHETASHEFAHEHHSPLTGCPLPHIEPQVDLWEVHKPRPTDTEHAAINKAKSHQTANSSSIEQIEFQTRRKMRLQQGRLNSVIGENQIPPLGRQKHPIHAPSVCSGMDQHESIHHAASLLHKARSVVVLTGAGISAESGLATFRDPEEGLWAKYDPMELATADAFRRDPELVTRWYHWRFTLAMDAQPNPGHHALAELERRFEENGRRLEIITQNVDGLHQRAGSRRVIEIHGSIHRWRCTKTGHEKPLSDLSFEIFPVPSEHGGLMRPCVVWFGEALPEHALTDTMDALNQCDLFLSVGTSATVWPAASFIEVAREGGAKTIEINRDATLNTAMVDCAVQGLSGKILPQVVAALRRLDDS